MSNQQFLCTRKSWSSKKKGESTKQKKKLSYGAN
jgi:hypothetical protein